MGTFWSRWFGPKIERGWVKLWGGRYHMDPSAFVNLRFRSFWMPWTFRREWGIYWLEGNPEPHPFAQAAQAASTPNRTAWAIEEAMDRTWIEQALRRPGLDWKIIVIFLLGAIAFAAIAGSIA